MLQALVRNIGDVTFHEAYRRTGVILNIPVSPGRCCCPARRRACPSSQSQRHPYFEARRNRYRLGRWRYH